MKNFFIATVLVIGFAIGAAIISCSPAGKQQVLHELPALVDVACIIANAELEDRALKAACNIAEDMLPMMTTVAANTRAQTAKSVTRMASKPCSSAKDAGQ